MRIAFVFSQDLNKPSGVLEKYSTMVDIWQTKRHVVDLFAISDPLRGRSPFRSGILHTVLRPLPGPNKLRSLQSYFRAIQLLTEQIRTTHADIVYMRDLTFAPAFISMMQSTPTVLEMNTINKYEQRLTMSKSMYLFNRVTEGWLQRLSKGIVAVTNEIAESIGARTRPIRVIPNGFDLARVLPPPSAVDRQRSIIFIGTPGYVWHGIDKIVELARRLPDWRFRIVGYMQEQMPTTDNLPNIQVLGLLPPHDYLEALRESSVAIGTLALHRNGMHESCSLKVREYLAHGIPVLLGNRDSDFPESRWFLKVLPNTENNITDHTEEIRQFAESVDGRRVQRDEIGHIDYQIREQERLAFLASRLSS